MVTEPMRTPGDFPNDVWLISRHADSLRETYAPSYFLSSSYAALYPVFAFYGGTLFAFTALLSLLTGSAAHAQALVYCLALASAYGGWLWLARMAGLRSWPAHAPAVLYVTAPYVMTNMHVRSDLTEFVATAMIPLLLASALSILRAGRLRAGPAAALAASTIGLGASHNITLLWSATILGITGVLLAVAVPQTRRLVTRRGTLRILAIAVPAMAVNAWYLAPDLAYHTSTVIAHRIDEWRTLVERPGPSIDARYLFALGRPSPFPGSGHTITLPVLAMAWVLVSAAFTRGSWRGPWWRALGVLAIVSAALIVTMRNTPILLVLPDPWLMLQFSYRLETFVLFGICGGVIAGLVLVAQSPHRWLALLLIPIMALAVVGAGGQVRDAPRFDAPYELNPHAFTAWNLGDFAPAGQPTVPSSDSTPLLWFGEADVPRDRIDVWVGAAPGEIVQTNLMAPPQMIDVQGAQVVGRWAEPPLKPDWQTRWFLALRIDADATPGKAHIVVSEARSFPIVAGKVVSVLGLIGLAVNAAVIAWVAWRRRRRARLG